VKAAELTGMMRCRVAPCNCTLPGVDIVTLADRVPRLCNLTLQSRDCTFERDHALHYFDNRFHRRPSFVEVNVYVYVHVVRYPFSGRS
jgi:hypothetical protein